MSDINLCARARVSALCLGLSALQMLSGCTFYNSIFHRSHDNGCSEKPFQGNSENLPGIVVPEGLSAPDTRNVVKVPVLTEPERVRARSEPCLAQPPNYGTGTFISTPVRSHAPMGQSAPAPAPVPVPPSSKPD
ncbi:MAG TPA: hypothetical protein VGH84_15645 [Steroidobacteraceae bacterium]